MGFDVKTWQPWLGMWRFKANGSVCDEIRVCSAEDGNVWKIGKKNRSADEGQLLNCVRLKLEQ